MKVVYEPAIPEHLPTLYRADRVHSEAVIYSGRLTESEIATFDTQGFLVVRASLTLAEVEAARDTLRDMTLADNPDCGSIAFEGRIQERLSLAIPSEATPSKSQFSLGTAGEAMPPLPKEERAQYVRKFMEFTTGHPALHALAFHANIVQIVEQLLGERSLLFQEMAMIKPPQGREKPWHQDHAYFNFPLSQRIVGVWIALGEVRPENGCMFVIAGGHRAGARSHFLRRDWQICDTESLALEQTAVPMQAGDVLYFDGKMPHGTPINRTEEVRWALQFHYVPASVVQTSDEERLAAFGSEGRDAVC
jgi:phytanoyl-CoA hydroxylase